MRYLIPSLCLVLTVTLVGTARAEDDVASDEDRGGRRAEMRQRMVDEFDADGDGKLSDTERTTAREKMRSRRGDANGRDDRRGRRGATPARKGRGAAGGRPDPAKLFDKYDADGDGQLSRDEFLKLTSAMRPPRGGPRPDGPPREGRRRFDGDQRPLENRGDRAGPAPPPAGPRREQRGERGGARFGERGKPGDPRAEGPGRGGPGRRGPDRRGPNRDGIGRQGPPDPARIFERFDENGDDQLSRGEFMKLAERMREMRGGDGPGGDGGQRGVREGRGPRRGAPGADGPPRSRRPPRSESAASESAATGSAATGSPAAGSEAPEAGASADETTAIDETSV